MPGGSVVSDAEAAQFRATGVLLKPAFFTREEAIAMRRSVDELRRRGLMANLQVSSAGAPGDKQAARP